MHLQILGTLPEFQRRGHASSICRWAMDHVLRKSLKDMSVMASPMGYNLYTVLGFERVGTFYIQVPGEDERLVLQAMMYKPNIWETKTTEDGDDACVML
jgi:ribosomal protein S18 acetylase RimI-like enzyme